MLKDVNVLLSDVSDVSEMLPAVAAWKFAGRKQAFTILTWLFSISAPIKIITLILARNNIHNLEWFHFLAMWEGCMLFAFYSKVLFSRVVWWGVAAIILIDSLDTLLLEPITTFNSFAWSVNTLILLCLGLLTFYKLYTSSQLIAPEEDPMFIINSGWMIYFAGALFTYALGSKILFSTTLDFFAESWIIVSFSNTIKNAVVCYGLYRIGKQ